MNSCFLRYDPFKIIKHKEQISLLGGYQGNILEIFVFNNNGQLFLYKTW